MIESIKSDLSVMINNTAVAGAVSVEITETNNDKYAREFLSDKHYALVRKAKKYSVKLEYYASEPFPYSDGFTLVIERDGVTESFFDCIIKSKSTVIKNGVKSIVLTIDSEEKE